MLLRGDAQDSPSSWIVTHSSWSYIIDTLMTFSGNISYQERRRSSSTVSSASADVQDVVADADRCCGRCPSSVTVKTVVNESFEPLALGDATACRWLSDFVWRMSDTARSASAGLMALLSEYGRGRTSYCIMSVSTDVRASELPLSMVVCAGVFRSFASTFICSCAYDWWM